MNKDLQDLLNKLEYASTSPMIEVAWIPQEQEGESMNSVWAQFQRQERE